MMSSTALRINSNFWLNSSEKCSKFVTPGTETESSVEQNRVEAKVQRLYKFYEEGVESVPRLYREKHISYLRKGLKHLPRSYESLDSSQPWLIYWILHSLALLGEPIDEEQAEAIIHVIGECQCVTGGFSGGPGQYAHLAPTYAAVNALAILSVSYPQALLVINRTTLTEFLIRMRNEDGSYKLEEDGEADTRGAYCAASVAVLTNLDVKKIFQGTAEWVASCQTYEGGFSGVPLMEAHGGYSYCALSALILLSHSHMCDVEALLRWSLNRQMRYEGGFQGRTNKLVDGCYSFWLGALVILIQNICLMSDDKDMDKDKWLFDSVALQEYILICCQDIEGGLLDKPGRPTDYYHTCYVLSGLSLAQHYESGDLYHKMLVGDEDKNRLAPIHPVHNIPVEAVESCRRHFATTYTME